jgi:hypothetical protein
MIVGLTQTTDFLPFAGHSFALRGEKMTCNRRKSTMLPQAMIAFA